MKSKYLLNSLVLAALGSVTAVSAIAPNKAIALTIMRMPFPAGPMNMPPEGGEPPMNSAGGGNIIDIFNAAADWWQMAILDDVKITINFGWADLGNPDILGITVGNMITFNNNIGTDEWFLDETPHQNEEYGMFMSTHADLGGGIVNTGRKYINPVDPDADDRYDLLTTAKHEIAHALGFLNPLPNPIVIGPGLPNSGTMIPTIPGGGGHIDPAVLPKTLLAPSDGFDMRVIQSGVDILAVAQQGGYTKVNLSPHVPEPSSVIGILALGTLGVGSTLKRKLKRSKSEEKEVKKVS